MNVTMFKAALVVSSVVLLSACSGGGDGGGGGTSSAAAPSIGSFVDSPVQGLRYNTATQSGVTDANGQFRYRPGESVTFSFGQTVLGTIPGVPQITPWTVFGLNSPDPADNRWVNLARLLQTFNNQLPAITPQIAALPAINFNQSPAAFGADPTVGQVLSTAGAPQTLVSAGAATATLTQQFAILGSWFIQGESGPNSLGVFTAMADGTFMVTGDSSLDPTDRNGMEHGTYIWNPATGAFSATVTVDTNGAYGLSGTNPPMTATISNNGNTLTFTDGAGPVALSRVIDTNNTPNPIIGSWLGKSLDNPNAPVVITFLLDGTIVHVEDNDPALSPSGQDGMERGIYTFNQGTGELLVTITLDTNREWGFHSTGPLPSSVSPITVTFTGADTLTALVPGEPLLTLTRIRTP